MKSCRWLVASLFLLTAMAGAQVGEKKVVVTPSLVADVEQMALGKPFTAAVRLKFAPGWHTYWQYPGEAGGAPQIQWELPAGFTAGPIQWPIPKAHVDEGDLLTYIYEEEVLLPVQITPPAVSSGEKVALKAKLRWLACEKICIPGQTDVSLNLAIGPDAVPANAELFAKWRALLPKTKDAPFQAKWQLAAKAVSVELNGLPKDRTVDFFPIPPAETKLGQPKTESSPHAARKTFQFPIVTGGTAPGGWAGVVVLTDPEGKRESWQIAAGAGTALLPEAPGSNPSAAIPDSGLPWKLLLAFVGGLIMNVMPCVLPVIALKIFGFVKQAGKDPAQILQLGLAFTAGVFAFFLLLAAAVSQLRGAFNFGYQFQNPWLLTGLIALVFVFALNLLGVFEITLSGGTATTLSALSSKEGFGGAFLHGMFTTLLGTSCTAPFLSTSLGYAVTQPTPIVFLFFTATAAGMSLPYLLLTARPAWLRFLPKPGVWMERVKQLMGFAMLAVVVWLFGSLTAHGSSATAAVSWFLLFLGLACWIFGVASRASVAWIGVAAALTIGYFGFLQNAFAAPAGSRIAWQPYSDAQVAAAIARGETVFIDFTADWCANCKLYEKVVLETEPIGQAFREKKVVAFKADWTTGDEEVTRALKRFGRVGVPLYVLHRPGETQPVILDALTSALLLAELAPIQSAPAVLTAN
ncbi:MAG TPA: protein-disulfide reductase DsbD domain-containing protein [Chthoniobacteraceae bacterium]|jgi:thiol:disulfide interchange protein DsbD